MEQILFCSMPCSLLPLAAHGNTVNRFSSKYFALDCVEDVTDAEFKRWF